MMSEMLKKLKKKPGDMSDSEKDAKMSVVQHMRDMASQMMGDKVKGLKKLTVASNSDEGLEAGLEKAKSMMHAHSDVDDQSPVEGSPEEEMESDIHGDESEDMPMGEDEEPEHDESELDRQIQELMKKKAMLKK